LAAPTINGTIPNQPASGTGVSTALKPEVAAALFLPVVEQMIEGEIPLDRWKNLGGDQENGPLEERKWIDEPTFRELIAALIDARQEARLRQVGKRLLGNEAIGLGGLLLPFVEEPLDLLRPLVDAINLNARTLRLTLQPLEGRQCTLLFASTAKRPGPPVLCTWFEGILQAAQETAPRFEYQKQECMFGLLEPSAKAGPAKKADAEARACVYALRWKRSRWAKYVDVFRRLQRMKDTLARTRKTLVHQQQLLGQSQTVLGQQEALLRGVVRMSEATKQTKTYRDLIHLTANRICSDFGFDRSQIYLAREGQLEIVAVIDPHDMNWAQTVFAVCQANPILVDDRTEESRAFTSGKPVVVNNPWNNIFVPQALQEAWKSKGYVIVPIRGADRVIGLMLADHYYTRQAVDPEDVNRLLALAHIAGSGIEKLRLIDRLEAKVSERTIELERANKKLMSLYEKARESDRLKSDFLANMSHELRTPLNSIIGFSKLLLREMDGNLNDRQKLDVNAILNSGTHLLSLINDILDLSKIESGRMELKMESFLLPEVVDEVLTTGAVLLKDKPIELSAHLDPDLRIVHGDRVRLRQVLLNLVSNAIKFTPKGQITITTKYGNSEYYIAVADTGMGMPAEKIDQAFERFRQLDSSPSRMQGGSGLGLTISKKFVEMHGGRIWVTSAEGVGSTFHVALPMRREVDKAAAE
jgi:signal transduction histidine kinase